MEDMMVESEICSCLDQSESSRLSLRFEKSFITGLRAIELDRAAADMDGFHVKPKKPWRNVDIGTAGFAQKDLDCLISVQELTDYEIVGSKKKKVRKAKKGKHKSESNTRQENQESDSIKKSPKTKRKKGKKQKKIDDAKEQSTLETDNAKDKTDPKTDKKTGHKKSKQKKNNSKLTKLEGNEQKVEDPNELMEANSNDVIEHERKQNLEKKGNKRKYGEILVEEGGPNKKPKLHSSAVSDKLGSSGIQGRRIAPIDKSLKGMEAWKELFVPDEVLWALRDQGFKDPTPIQSQVLASAIRDKMDIVGAAETGSGKTLAFGIPVLHFILQQRRIEADDRLLRVSNDGDVDDDSDGSSGDGGDIEEDAGIDTDDDNAINQQKESDQDEEYNEDAADSDNGECDENIDNTDDGIEEEDGDDEDDDDENIDDTVDRIDDDEKTETSDTASDGEESPDEEVGDLQPDGRGCVKVIQNADFSWLKDTPHQKAQATHPRALILEPTRELAIQVKNHLQAVAIHTDIKIAAIVGGLAIPKQQRILKTCPDILVATPGRLWELVQQGEVYLSEIEKTWHLVVDEADRMTEKGHFEELAKLLERMKRDPDRENRHTYVFSATLTLIHSGPQRMLKKKKKKWDERQKLNYLMRKMGLKHKPKVVDLTRKVGTVESLTEARINCTKEEKDMYLYYFLKQYPGRTLVFTNSKDCIRRLVSIFTLLQCKPLPLHADMHQRQRLKNLDKFTGNPKAVLIASDVAARGLDIPNVQHVIHYQVPHTVENYVHRSGRTARACKEGLSIMLTGPDDVKNYRKVIHTLNKSEDLPMFPVEQQILSEISRRVNMVREIETQEYRFKKSKRHNDWFRKAADEVGVDIDDEGLLTDLGDDAEQNRHSRYIKQMKADLTIMLKQPLLARSSFTKYPTMSGKLIAPSVREEKRDAVAHVKKNKKVKTDLVGDTANLQKNRNNRRDRRRKKKKEISNEDTS